MDRLVDGLAGTHQAKAGRLAKAYQVHQSTLAEQAKEPPIKAPPQAPNGSQFAAPPLPPLWKVPPRRSAPPLMTKAPPPPRKDPQMSDEQQHPVGNSRVQVWRGPGSITTTPRHRAIPPPPQGPPPPIRPLPPSTPPPDHLVGTPDPSLTLKGTQVAAFESGIQADIYGIGQIVQNLEQQICSKLQTEQEMALSRGHIDKTPIIETSPGHQDREVFGEGIHSALVNEGRPDQDT